MQRVDKWLWFARAVKTRTRAAEFVGEGRIRLNGQRVEAPAKSVKPGDVITMALPERTLVWKVLGVGDRRGPASEARLLYEDLSPAAPVGATPDSVGPQAAPGRPTKQERRAMARLLGRE